jgi:hypothetical protein
MAYVVALQYREYMGVKTVVVMCVMPVLIPLKWESSWQKSTAHAADVSDACCRWRTHDSSVSYTAPTYRRCANTCHGRNKHYKKASTMQWWKEHSSLKGAGWENVKYNVKQIGKGMENRSRTVIRNSFPLSFCRQKSLKRISWHAVDFMVFFNAQN